MVNYFNQRLLVISIISFFLITISAVRSMAGSATLAWDVNIETGLTGYKLYYKTYSGSVKVPVSTNDSNLNCIDIPIESLADADNPQYKIESLQAGMYYAFAVTACASNLESGFSNTVFFPSEGIDGDSDDDGLSDNEEDANHNGIVDLNETDPFNSDTDGDGIQDGTEKGLTIGSADTDYAFFIADADPMTTTDPVQPDSDADGIEDGEEDTNFNGKVDVGETDPNDGQDYSDKKCECDLNDDGSCNILDVQMFFGDWDDSQCDDPGVVCECDLNGDGMCNILDYQRFIQDWGQTDCP